MSNEKRQGGHSAGRKLLGTALCFSAIGLAGCAGPTYGTGTPAEQQLLEDLTGALSLAPDNKPQIRYEPRPGLVEPPSKEVLPPPQKKIASAQNPAWPESPEQRLARVRADATAHQDDPSYRPNIIRDVDYSSDDGDSGDPIDPSTQAKQRAEFLRRQQIAEQGSPAARRYLSDPPLDYRKPSDTAPVGETGTDEWKKERAKRRSSDKSGLARLLPW